MGSLGGDGGLGASPFHEATDPPGQAGEPPGELLGESPPARRTVPLLVVEWPQRDDREPADPRVRPATRAAGVLRQHAHLRRRHGRGRLPLGALRPAGARSRHGLVRGRRRPAPHQRRQGIQAPAEESPESREHLEERSLQTIVSLVLVLLFSVVVVPPGPRDRVTGWLVVQRLQPDRGLVGSLRRVTPRRGRDSRGRRLLREGLHHRGLADRGFGRRARWRDLRRGGRRRPPRLRGDERPRQARRGLLVGQELPERAPLLGPADLHRGPAVRQPGAEPVQVACQDGAVAEPELVALEHVTPVGPRSSLSRPVASGLKLRPGRVRVKRPRRSPGSRPACEARSGSMIGGALGPSHAIRPNRHH